MESEEALHLCISCKDAESYRFVTSEVTSLFESIYRQYKEWCTERGLDHPTPRVVYKETGTDSQNQTGSTYATEAYGLTSLYPPNWESWKSKGHGASPSPTSLSTHPGNSGVPTPPDLLSPSGSRCVLDVSSIEKLIEDRNEARRVCNFKEADRIRDILKSHGISLMDEPGARGKGREVTSWRYGMRK